MLRGDAGGMPFPARVATSVALSLTAVVVVAAAAGNRTHARSDAPGPRVLYTVPDARLRFTRDADFVGWAAAHGRVYASTAERAAAEDTWRTNRAWALAMNAQNERRRVDDDDRGVSAHVLSVDGPFADMTHEAFVATVIGTSLKTFRLSAPSRNDGDGGARARGWERGEPPPPSPSPPSPPPSPLPPVVDWVSEGVVAGPVADQGKCGSCWAISAVEAMEAVFKQRTGTFKRGSVQQILDCDREASGCAGGAFDSAYEWVEANGGMTTADDYPYRERRGECELRGEDGHPHRKVINIDGHGKVPPGEAHLLRRVATQPVAAALEANREVQLYHSGVLRPFDPDCGAGVNHAVLVVGYDVRGGGKESVNESPYVKVKNSWGKRWGEDGFARLALTGDDTRGACGVGSPVNSSSIIPFFNILRCGIKHPRASADPSSPPCKNKFTREIEQSSVHRIDG